MIKNTIEFWGTLLLVVTFALMCIGCGTIRTLNKVEKYGIVAWNYQSVVKDVDNTLKAPVSIRINDFNSIDPSHNMSWGTFPAVIIPIVGLVVPAKEKYVNKVRKVDLKQGELEQILVNEIRKSNIFVKITFQGEPTDYDINGDVNCIADIKTHTCGFGIIFFLSIPLFLTLPLATEELKCEAHFEVISSIDEKKIFSNSYSANTKFLAWVYSKRDLEAFGAELFPKIVENFIADLKELPEHVWNQ